MCNQFSPGDPNEILRRPKAGLRNVSEWSQMDSDTIAHFIQVTSQIQLSRWFKSDVTFKAQGNVVLGSSFPAFEDFVFAAIYLRQLIATNDDLLGDAVARYCRFVDCAIRPPWLQSKVEAFKAILSNSLLMLPGCTLRECFDAFVYGAGLFHKTQDIGRPNRERFKEVYDNCPRHELLYGLHGGLRSLMYPVSCVAVVIHRDFSHWLPDYSLPAPDIRWHDRLFRVTVGQEG